MVGIAFQLLLMLDSTVRLAVPRAAVQTIRGDQFVFVRTANGFRKRSVKLGSSDDASFEVLSGLEPGETVAVANTFVIKAGPKHEVLGTNSIGEPCRTSIAIADGKLFIRGDKHLFCVGNNAR